MRRNRNPTVLCSDLVDVVCLGKGGEAWQSKAILEEIAPARARLLLETEAPPGGPVAVVIEPLGYSGRAGRCAHSEAGVRIDVRFDRGVRWRAEEYQPTHSFDPRTIIRALQRNM